jgi:hypothetical protein
MPALEVPQRCWFGCYGSSRGADAGRGLETWQLTRASQPPEEKQTKSSREITAVMPFYLTEERTLS